MSENPEISADTGTVPALPAVRLEDRLASELPALAAGLVHEVKNPLAAIHLHLQLLQNYINEVEDADLREKLQDKVGFIKSQILGLNTILHDFLSAIRSGVSEKREVTGHSSKIPGQQSVESDKVDLNHQVQSMHPDLNSLLKEIITLLRPQADRSGIIIKFLPDADVAEKSASFYWDSAFIKQIAVNLIINAIQAHKSETDSNKDKYIEIITGIIAESADVEKSWSSDISDSLITSKTEKDTHDINKKTNSRLYFSVLDNGPGISQSNMEKLFDPFYTTKETGSGLGLAIVKKMISDMKGKVEVHSDPGKGTEFKVIFGNLNQDSNPNLKSNIDTDLKSDSEFSTESYTESEPESDQ
jgi:two-component system, sporulation sensor kinase E